MELAFFTLLLKDGAKSVGGGIAINDKGVLETGLSEDWGSANCVDESIECGFMFIFPVEFAAFSAVSDERIEWGGKHAEISNVHAIKVEEAKKGT